MDKKINDNELFITKVLNSAISKGFDDNQLKELKNILYIQLHNITLVTNCFDLAPIINADSQKMDYFITSKKISGLAESSLEQYKRTAWNLRNVIQKNFDEITTADIKFYLFNASQKGHWKNTTMNNQIMYLKTFYGFLANEELIGKNPMNKIEKVKEEKIIKDSFTIEELEKLKNACHNDARDIALIEFLLATGIRVSELCSLHWKDLDKTSKSFIVKGKGNKERRVYYTDKTAFYLQEYFNYRLKKEGRTKEEMLERPLFSGAKRDKVTKDYEQITKDGVRYVLNKLATKAGVTNVHPHKFRRTFATTMINRGMPLENIKKLLGHNNYDTTLIYAEIANNKVENLYRQYSYN